MKLGSLVKISSKYGPYRALELRRKDIAGCYGVLLGYNSYENFHAVMISGEIVQVYPKTWIEVIQ